VVLELVEQDLASVPVLELVALVLGVLVLAAVLRAVAMVVGVLC